MAEKLRLDSAGLLSAMECAQVAQSFRQLPISLVANLIIGLLLASLLWDSGQRAALGLWLLALLSVTVVRYLLLRAYGRADPDARARRQWATVSVLGACGAGLVWGAAGYFLFVTGSLQHQVLLAFVLAGMVAGAVPLLSFLYPAYPCFAIPIVLPIAWRMLEAGDHLHRVMGLMILVFGLAMLAASAQLRRFFLESTELRSRLAEAVEVEHALERMVHVDALTDLANRRYFENSLDDEWRRSRRDRNPLSLITADIDAFKAYNDHYGHPAGDECLVAVAGAMRAVVRRAGDLVARIGGEEFAVLLPRTTLEDAMRIAESMRGRVEALRLPHAASEIGDRVTLSLGVASSQDPGVDSTGDLARHSDRALYLAKRQGRNQVATTVAPGEHPRASGDPGAGLRADSLADQPGAAAPRRPEGDPSSGV
jgi:diguanylate cyclase (GGDEF)-like protein